jgi:hypothetical protein
MSDQIASAPPQNEKDVSSLKLSHSVMFGIVGTSITLGCLGIYEGFIKSKNETPSMRVLESLSQGVIYATGIGFVAEKLKR